MIIEVLSYLIPLIQIVLPAYFVFNIWRKRVETKAAWAIHAMHGILSLLILFLVFRWDLAGNSLRYWWNGLCLAGILVSYRQAIAQPWYDKQAFSWSWGIMLELVLLIGGLAWVSMGLYPDKQPVDMHYPLKGESYFVVHGGDTPILNYHGGAVYSQKYALDINQLNGWGRRSSGVYPENPGRYAIFGDRVYSPIQGTVVQIADSLSDLRPPNRQPAQPAGNHVWVKNNNLYVLLAHLKQHSIQVEEGEQVQVGQPLARVGNTGNTTEPHLHMHAVKNPKLDTTGTGTRFHGGKPVPISFNDRFLIRNDTFSK
ncbi:MAG: M23 family metallopeptidase [Balneolaceae bacterium]|nr:M23 family metallopeptidase [Balneolaceae bacterium]